MVACLNVDTFLGDWHPGFGDKWGAAPKLYFSGCDVGPHATVHGHVLRYSVVTRPGQVVRFSEHGASAGGAIGTAHGAHGTLRWEAADGRLDLRPHGERVTVPRVARGTHATITVRALSASGLPGRPATAKVR